MQDLRHTVILTAFDGRQSQPDRFRSRFLKSLRAAGNHDTVVAVTYGLPRDLNRELARIQNVRIVAKPKPQTHPSIHRLVPFREITADLPPTTKVGIWDAGDVLFQSSLEALWELLETSPKQVHVCRESLSQPIQRALQRWIWNVRSPHSQAWLRKISRNKDFLNAGGLAGTAAAMHEYYSLAVPLLDSPILHGTGGWDQMALNVLQWHFRPDLFKLMDEDWNYCMNARSDSEFSIVGRRIYLKKERRLIPVVHANGHSAKPFWAIYDRSPPPVRSKHKLTQTA